MAVRCTFLLHPKLSTNFKLLMKKFLLQVFDGIKTEFPFPGEEDKIEKPPPAVPPNISPNGPSLDNATANLLQVCICTYITSVITNYYN